MSFEKILLGKKYLAIEVFSKNGDHYAVLEAEQKKKELRISRSDVFSDLEDVKKYKSKNPLVLVINNNQVLQKEVAGNEINDKKLLHKAFPNIRLEEFYYDIWRREASSVIAICRKSYADEVCRLIGENFKLSGISLGGCSISVLNGIETPDIITTNTHLIDFIHDDNGVVLQDVDEQKQYNLNGLEVNNTQILSFCGILKCILNLSSTNGSINDVQLQLLENYKQHAFFQKGLVTAVSVILVALLINFFLFTHYFEKLQLLNQTLTLNSGNVENVTQIKKRVNDKEKKLLSFNSGNASRSSLILNEIVKELPSSILLSGISYNPLEKKIKDHEAVITQDGSVIISGTTLSNEAFIGWVNAVEELVFIHNVTIVSFGKDDNNDTKFSIKINLKK
jgi:hypothetical protein